MVTATISNSIVDGSAKFPWTVDFVGFSEFKDEDEIKSGD